MCHRTQKTRCTHYANADERRDNIPFATDLHVNCDVWYTVWVGKIVEARRVDHSDRCRSSLMFSKVRAQRKGSRANLYYFILKVNR